MLINCTPHPIDIYRTDRTSVLATIKPSGIVVRLQEEAGPDAGNLWLTLGQKHLDVVDWEETDSYALSVPCVTRTWGDVTPTMPRANNMIYIVPMPVLSALKPRPDVCCPDFGAGAVRNARGTVVGTTALVFKHISKFTGRWRWTGSMDELLAEFPHLNRKMALTSTGRAGVRS